MYEGSIDKDLGRDHCTRRVALFLGLLSPRPEQQLKSESGYIPKSKPGGWQHIIDGYEALR
jgi:hypothetical protein